MRLVLIMIVSNWNLVAQRCSLSVVAASLNSGNKVHCKAPLAEILKLKVEQKALITCLSLCLGSPRLTADYSKITRFNKSR